MKKLALLLLALPLACCATSQESAQSNQHAKPVTLWDMAVGPGGNVASGALAGVVFTGGFGELGGVSQPEQVPAGRAN